VNYSFNIYGISHLFHPSLSIRKVITYVKKSQYEVTFMSLAQTVQDRLDVKDYNLRSGVCSNP